MLVNYEQDERARHGLNIKAVLYSGLIIGALFLLVPRGHPWASSSLPTHAMGRSLFASEAQNVFLITGIVELAMAVAYAFVVAALTYWMRTMPAILTGGAIGAILYAVNYLTFRFLLQNAPSAAESTVALVHVGFCMIVAGAYKGFSTPRPKREQAG